MSNTNSNHTNKSLPIPKIYSVSFQTLGCKVNRYETDAVRQAFEDMGFQVISDFEHADICIINTCTVTAEADRKSRQIIRRAKRNNPGAIVVAMGCHIELLKSSSEADIAVGTKNRLCVIDRVLEKIGKISANLPQEYLQDSTDPKNAEQEKTVHKISVQKNYVQKNYVQMHNDLEDSVHNYSYQEFGSVLSQEETRAYIKIEDGCDSFCSYCIIPLARGPVVSRRAEDIMEEANALGQRGFREIVLTGIHICSYGKDRGEGISALGNLLAGLGEIPTIHRIRIGSLEPNSMTEDFVRRLSQIKKLCPHFHISLQSGSDTVLSRMNRKYDTKKYEYVMSLFYKYFDSFAVTTDIIVAFPAETQLEHEESLRFCRKIGFSRIHVFPFSARSGTQAAGIFPRISADIADSRKKDFLLLSKELCTLYCSSFIGRKVEVLLENRDQKNYFLGYTKEYVRVHVEPHEDYCEGNEASVLIIDYAEGELIGRIAPEYPSIILPADPSKIHQ